MADYDARAKAMAARMLAPKSRGGKGQVTTLHMPAIDGTFDPATDTTTGASPPADHTGSGAEASYSAHSIDGTVIQSGDVKFLLSPRKADGADMPRPIADSSKITKADGVWTVKGVSPISPAGLDAAYELQLRR